MPLPAESFLTALHLHRNLSPARCIELTRPLVTINHLPRVDSFVRIATDERAAKEVCQSHATRESSEAYKTLVRCGRDERRIALERLQTLRTAVGNIRRRPLVWIPDAIHGVLSDQDRP